MFYKWRFGIYFDVRIPLMAGTKGDDVSAKLLTSGWNMEYSCKWPSDYLRVEKLAVGERMPEQAIEALAESIDRLKLDNPMLKQTWQYPLPMKACSIYLKKIVSLELGVRYLLVNFEADGSLREQAIEDRGYRR
jgi:hypothetical protein